MSARIPYTASPRPDTGLTNGTLGLWLFLASETMLFGSLLSAYAILRSGATDWEAPVHLTTGIVATVLLAAASAAMLVAQRTARRGRFGWCRAANAAAFGIGLAFLAVKFADYSSNAAAGFVPATNNFAGLYYVLTGLHALHVLGGLIVIGYFAGPGARLSRTDPGRFAGRVGVAAGYWHFVDAVWLVLFAVLYLA